MPEQQQQSAPTTDGLDERLDRRMVIKWDPERKHRVIEVDGETFPTYTRGEIHIREVRASAFRDSGGYWPASPEDVQVPASGKVICYEVQITCFINEDCLEIEDPSLVVSLPPIGVS